MLLYQNHVGRHSSVGIENRYSPVIKSRLRHDFPHPSRTAVGSTQPLAQRKPDLFPEGKAAGAWR